uniref:Methyltransferase type 11 domain-containing protein n=1 Tax=Aegilops tauschii subsp. strangulata TaxID=200361 RepID=A0A452Z1A8_AEGTS
MHLFFSLPLYLPLYQTFSVGTLDAMMCGDDAPHGAYKMLAEVARLMRPGGIYMLVHPLILKDTLE